MALALNKCNNIAEVGRQKLTTTTTIMTYENYNDDDGVVSPYFNDEDDLYDGDFDDYFDDDD